MFGIPKVEIIEGEADINKVYIRWIGPSTYEAIIECKTKYPKLKRYGGNTVLIGVENFSLYKNKSKEGKLTQVVFNGCTIEMVEDAKRYDIRCILMKKRPFDAYHTVYNNSKYSNI